MDDYAAFLDSKIHTGAEHGFDAYNVPGWLFPFQQKLTEWAIAKGRCAVFADCGLGKGPMQIVWAHNVHQHTEKPVLILTPLAVAPQFESEGAKFGIEVKHSRDGKVAGDITVTNYQKLHLFDSTDYGGVSCDESSILKNFDGATKDAVTQFMLKVPYRALWTATAAPNDYIELGTSSEAIGELGFMDMLGRFFKKAKSTISRSDEFRAGVYAFRGHAERDFWRWVCSWARAVRKPSDLGFEDGDFQLPPLRIHEHIVKAKQRRDGWLFDTPAIDLHEQREERRRTIKERCEKAAELILKHNEPAVAWCGLNDEGHLLERLIPGSVNIEGSDSEEFKEETLAAFSSGQLKRLVTKEAVCGFGLNWQFCAHQTYFPSHSFERWYQAVRRSWRFGQKNPVLVDVIASEGEAGVRSNLNRKAIAAAKMADQLVQLMNNELNVKRGSYSDDRIQIPAWL